MQFLTIWCHSDGSALSVEYSEALVRFSEKYIYYDDESEKLVISMNWGWLAGVALWLALEAYSIVHMWF